MERRNIVNLVELFLGELEREADATRRTLERVPEGLYDWRPHPKSMAFGYLTELVARLVGWPVFVINQDSLDLMQWKAPPLKTAAELVAEMDKGLKESREAFRNTTEEHLMKKWQLKAGDQVLSEDPRHIVLRDGCLNHLAHHRGQLTVYLRLNNVPIPSIYGPSADEQPKK